MKRAIVLKPIEIAAPVAEPDSRGEFAVEGYQPLLPDGIVLEAKYTGHDTALIFRTAKIFLRFEVTELGPYLGVRLYRAFRARRLEGRPGPAGRFVLHARGDLMATLCRLLDIKARPDRVSLRDLKHCLFRVKVRTVHRNHAGEEMPAAMRYSVIDEIERGE